MVKLTYIARLADGLPLCASTDEWKGAREFKNLAKDMCRRLSAASPTRLTITADGAHVFHYAIENDVIYITLCESRFPKRNAFGYLEDIQREFHMQHGDSVGLQARPWAFIQFDQYIEKASRHYNDSGGNTSNLDKVNTELLDVQRIMVKNIDQVLDRGEQLDQLGSRAAQLKDGSKAYLKNAKQLSWDVMIRKYAPVAAVSIVVLFFLYYRFAL